MNIGRILTEEPSCNETVAVVVDVIESTVCDVTRTWLLSANVLIARCSYHVCFVYTGVGLTTISLALRTIHFVTVPASLSTMLVAHWHCQVTTLVLSLTTHVIAACVSHHFASTIITG